MLLVVGIARYDSSSRLALHPARRVQIGTLFRAHSLGELNSVDPRVLAVAALMQAQPERNFAAQELADHVCLSPSRLSALFAENMGLPLRRYRIWLRLRSIAGFLSQGLSLTDAALMAGFSDSSHFSNSCRKLLGIKPTDVLASDGSLRILLSTRL